MDNFEEILFNGLLDKYIEENKQFDKGQVVYFERSYGNDMPKTELIIGIVVDITITKFAKKLRNTYYDDYVIVYTISHPKGVNYNITANRITSVSDYILKSRINNDYSKKSLLFDFDQD